MISLFIFSLFLVSTSALVPYGSYIFNIVNYGGSDDYLRIYGYNNSLLANIALPVSQRSPNALWIDLESYPIKVLRNYGGFNPPVYLLNPAHPYIDVEVSLYDVTLQWNRINFRRSSTVLAKGKYNLLEDASNHAANIAYGRLQAGDEGMTQGYFPVCDPDYRLNIVTVNTNDLANPAKSTLSCTTVDCSGVGYSTSPLAPVFSASVLSFTTWPSSKFTPYNNKVSGLSAMPTLEVSAYCINNQEVNNVYYTNNVHFTTDLDLFVIDSATGQRVTSGKTYIVQNSNAPPVSEASQASIDLGVNYPTAQYNDAL